MRYDMEGNPKPYPRVIFNCVIPDHAQETIVRFLEWQDTGMDWRGNFKEHSINDLISSDNDLIAFSFEGHITADSSDQTGYVCNINWFCPVYLEKPLGSSLGSPTGWYSTVGNNNIDYFVTDMHILTFRAERRLFNYADLKEQVDKFNADHDAFEYTDYNVGHTFHKANRTY
jgi:hypothetical protein